MSAERSRVNSPVLIIVAVAIVYALIVIYMYFAQHRLLFLADYPSRALGPGPDSIGLAYDNVHIVTEDNVRLNGWFIPALSPRGVVLFFHGNAGNISHRLDSLKIFHDLGLSTLIIDYRGYGISEGRVSEAGTYRDAEATWRYLTQERGVPEKISSCSAGRSAVRWRPIWPAEATPPPSSWRAASSPFRTWPRGSIHGSRHGGSPGSAIRLVNIWPPQPALC
ncbi:MAG TPA: alpha/beta hydrolase [Afifellaceae bacterium]|nr:alpha/beta hydrolase [Afifellaceae bacterium]